jgi:hypothetical protein
MLEINFWSLVGVFGLILCEFFCSGAGEFFKGKIFLVPLIVFSLLGGTLIVLTLKKKVKGKLRKFLMLTGICSSGFFVGVLLHNFFYAMGVIAKQMALLYYLFEFLHVAFFLLATIVCPLGFLVGIIGVIVMRLKRGRKVFSK